ncbi:MAG: HD domain-containing protein [Candidatus Micrarchaeia archaeon]
MPEIAVNLKEKEYYDLKFYNLERIFNSYAKNFLELEHKDPARFKTGYSTKIVHTYNVVSNIEYISGALGLDAHQVFLAKTAALFHDIGRFPQLYLFGSFSDRNIDHAYLSVKTINEEGFLKDASNHTKRIILTAIGNHNGISIKNGLNKEEEFYAKLLRDADKIDILRIAIADHESKKGNPLIFGSGSGISDKVLEDFIAGKPISIRDVKSADDIVMLRLAFIYDMNFIPSFKMIQERGYVEKLANTFSNEVPKELKAQIAAIAERFIKLQINGGNIRS